MPSAAGRRLPLLAVLAIAGCASGGAAGSPPDAPPAASRGAGAVAFAPALEVDVAAMTRRSSGLLVRDLAVGDGTLAARGSRVTVRYTGWLADGTAFDSSEGGGGPVTFRLGAGTAIRGWEDGLVGVREGGRRQLVVPPRLAYGARGLPGKVPPNATLVFVVELVAVR
jgi:peptidylprolyl isomerase